MADPRALAAIEHACTHRYVDARASVIDAINAALRRHLLCERSLSETVTDVQKLLVSATRDWAMTICYTEVARAYNTANYERMVEHAARIPCMRKQWLREKNRKTRGRHSDVSEQAPIPVMDPFRIPNPETGAIEELRFPLDPNASVSNTLGCGCMLVTVLPDDPAEIFRS